MKRKLQSVIGAVKRWGSAFRSWLEQLRRRKRAEPQAPPPMEPSLLVQAETTVPEPALEPIRLAESQIWDRIEVFFDSRPLFRQELFVSKIKHKEEEILKAFGDPEPHSGCWLLHYGPHWEQNLSAARKEGREVFPVLLVHGAGCTANTVFPRGKLIPTLEREGLVLFAVTFAHPHGDNWQQAEVIANAIARIRMVTGASQVDVIAHSKGGVPARIYCSDLHLQDGTPYRGDVRRLLLVGAPNNGIDMAFRHPLLFWYGSWFAAAPSPYVPPLRHSLYPGGAFEGQSQLINVLRDEVPLKDPDIWNARRLYQGGLTLYGYSYGAEWAERAAGNLIDRLNEQGINPDIEVAVLAGNDSDLVVDGIPVMGETDGESDGVVLVKSALYTAGLTRRGAKLLAADLLTLDHLALVKDRQAVEWMVTQLTRPHPREEQNRQHA